MDARCLMACIFWNTLVEKNFSTKAWLKGGCQHVMLKMQRTCNPPLFLGMHCRNSLRSEDFRIGLVGFIEIPVAPQAHLLQILCAISWNHGAKAETRSHGKSYYRLVSHELNQKIMKDDESTCKLWGSKENLSADVVNVMCRDSHLMLDSVRYHLMFTLFACLQSLMSLFEAFSPDTSAEMIPASSPECDRWDIQTFSTFVPVHGDHGAGHNKSRSNTVSVSSKLWNLW